MKFWFWLLWSIDALATLVVLYFFFVGLSDGSISSFNAGLWTVILVGVAGVVGGSVALRAAGQHLLAVILLLVLAIPATLFGAFILLVVIAKPRWN